MHKIKFTSESKRDIQDIYSYISSDSIEYAAKVIMQIHKMISHLKDFPYLGTIYEGKLRKLVDPKYKYTIFYVFEEDIIYIKQVFKHQNY